MQTAICKPLEDGSYFGEIPSLSDVWAHDATLESCQQELRQVLEEWLALNLYLQHPIPAINSVGIDPPQRDLSDDQSDIQEARLACELVT